MADQNQPATDAVDLGKLQSTVNTLAQTVTTLASSQADLLKNVNIIANTMVQDQQQNAAAGKAAAGDGKGKDQPVTLDAIASLIDQKMNAASQQQQSKAARDGYIGEKLKDLPLAYRNQLGTDPAKWDAESQSIRDQYKADMKAAGAPEKNLGDVNKDGGQPPASQPIDMSKMSPMEKLELATKNQAVIRPSATVTTTTAAIAQPVTTANTTAAV